MGFQRQMVIFVGTILYCAVKNGKLEIPPEIGGRSMRTIHHLDNREKELGPEKTRE